MRVSGGVGSTVGGGGGGGIAVADLFSMYTGGGSDGAVTVSNGQTVTLTHDMTYTTLVVQSGGIVESNGWRIYATDSIDVQLGGAIRFVVPATTSPGSVAPTNSGTLGLGSTRSTGSIGAGVGGLSAAGPGSQTTYSFGYGGAGGAGGTTGTGVGGVGAVLSNEEETFAASASPGFRPSAIRRLPWKRLDIAVGEFGYGNTNWRGGAGGGGGSGVDASHKGGAGGNGGGVIFLAAPAISVNGTVRADGASGATSPSATNGGGGGGGGGGLIVTNSLTAVSGTPTFSVAGGAGGAGVGAGTSGASGASGLIINNVWS